MLLGHLFAAAVVAGACWGLLTDAGILVCLAVAATAVAAMAVAERSVRIAGLLLAIAACSAAHGAAARDRVRTVVPVEVAPAPLGPADEPVLVDGQVVRDAHLTANGAVVLVDVRRVRLRGAWQPARFRMQAYVGGAPPTSSVEQWRRGRTIRASVVLRAPQVLRNPGGRSPRLQTLLRAAQLNGTIKSALLVEVARGRWWSEVGGGVRAYVRHAAAALFPPERDESRAVLVAILIGDRVGLDPQSERLMQRAGTYHVLAISGGNVALLAGLVMLLARLIVRSYRGAALLSLVVVLAYGGIVGGEPSVSRATTAAAVYLSAVAAGLAPSPLHVFSLTAAVAVLVEPVTAVEPGAWLSYGATVGILLFASRVGARLERAARQRRRVLSAMVTLLSATVAAELILLPIAAVLFARVGIAGLALNFVAIPAMAVVQCAGGLAVALLPIWTRAAAALAVVVDLGVRAMVGSAGLVTWMPWLSWRVVPPSGLWVVAFFAALAAVVRWPPRTRRRHIAICLLALVTAGVFTAPETMLARPARARLRVSMLDVGQGESIVVQFPNGRSMTIDAGAASDTFDLGERVVVPALWALGVRRLDWLLVTHPDLDHIGGAAAVADALDVREIWDGVPVPANVQWQALRRAAEGRTWRSLQRGDRLRVGEVDVEVLSPPLPDWERQKPRNDDSVVLRVDYGGVQLLLTGDAGASVEDGLNVDGRAPLRILKVGHHGSRSSTGAPLVERYAPVLALVSAGAGNIFGHPAPDVVDRLARAGTSVFRTDRDGALIVETDGREVWVRTWSGRTWTAAASGPAPRP